MKALTLVPGVALAALLTFSTRTPPEPAHPPVVVAVVEAVPQDPAPPQPEARQPAPAPEPTPAVEPSPAPVVEVTTPPVVVPAAVTVTPPAPVQRPSVPPSLPGTGMPTLLGTVILPDGSTWLAPMPLPTDPQGFTWRTYKSRQAPGKSILGMHVYAPRQEPDMILGTIRWSNGAVAPSGKGFCGAVYYNSFMLSASNGWEWVVLPQFGQTTRGNIWVVVPPPAKGNHLARPREMMEWAYALVPAGNAAARAKAEAALRYANLVIPAPFNDYGPAHVTLPTVDRIKFGIICKEWAAQLLDAQAKGGQVHIDNIADVESDAIGPHWMDGNPAAYAHGGYAIDPDGVSPEQVPDGVLVHAIMHRANISRSFIAAYNVDTGNPIGLNEWTAPPNPNLMQGEMGKENEVEILPFLEGTYYTYRYPRFNIGTCVYEYDRIVLVNGIPVVLPGIWSYYAHDVAHSIRAMRNALALVEYANDPSARDDLMLIADTNRYGFFSDRADEHTQKKNPNDGYWPVTLTQARETIDAAHNQGGWFDRNWAWSAFAGACAIEYERDPAKKAAWKAWGRDMLDARLLAADKFGFSGRYYAGGYLPDDVAGLQTFHEMLVICHTVTLGTAVYGTVPANLVEVNRKGLVSALAVLHARPYGGEVGPPHWIGTYVDGNEIPALNETITYGEGDPAHVYAAVALTYRADPTHPEVLNLALPHWHPTGDLPQMLDYCRSRVPNKAWSATMEAVLEQKLAH